MPRLVGFSESTFNADSYRQATKNHGVELTTEGILKGIELIANEIREHPDDNWLAAMKDTPAYISPVKNNR